MSISTKIFANTKKVLAQKGNIRQDLAISDYKMLDDSHANILIAYTEEIPTVREISNFVVAKYEGKVFPLLETACNYGECKCVSITCTPPTIKRSLDDKSSMMKITASTFLDVKDKSEWKVEKNPSTGVSYLARALVEDFEKIISARKARIGSSMAVTASAKFNVVEASYLSANEDDYVKFFDGMMRVGTVRSVEPDGKTIKIMDDDGELFVVDRSSIIEIIRKDPDEVEKMNNDMEGFYAEFLGKKYASELFKKGPIV